MKKIPWNLVYLKYFFDSVKHNSVSKAAIENRISQSAISQAITKLEQALEVSLILHQPNRFNVTEEGQKLFEGAKTIFQALKLAEENLTEIPPGKVAFASMHSLALALLPPGLKRAKTNSPELEIEFRLAHTDAIKEWVKKGMIDFGIVLDNDDLSAFEKEEIYQGEYRLFIAKGLLNFEQQGFLLSEERIETNLLKSYYRQKFGKDLKLSMEISSWEVIARLTEEGLGIGFFPDYIGRAPHANLELAPLTLEPIFYKIYAIFDKKAHLSLPAKALIECFKIPSQSPLPNILYAR